MSLSRSLFSRKPKTNDEAIPIDLDSAIVALMKKMGDNGVKTLKQKPESYAIMESQTGIGHWIRSSWQLWIPETPLRSWFAERLVTHADDMSMILLVSASRFVKERPIEIEKQLSAVREYHAGKNICLDKLKKKRRQS